MTPLQPPTPPVRPGLRASSTAPRLSLAAIGFLLPNFIGFAVFTFFPILFSLWMAFTNWTLKPAVERQFVGLRNFQDLLGLAPIDGPRPAVLTGFLLAAMTLGLGLVTALLANVARWRGIKTGGLLLLAGAIGGLALSMRAGSEGPMIASALAVVCGLAVVAREDGDWRLGWGALPALLILAGAAGLGLLQGSTWQSYEPRDARFWKYLYNTLYLMLGIPLSIAGSLGLALLLNNSFSFGRDRTRIAGAALCAVCALATVLGAMAAGHPNVALLGGILWAVAAMGIGFNVVAFRTLLYLPTFCAGVALMILWKNLYNPQTGPINVGLRALFQYLGWSIEPPSWLTDIAWAKPALIFMGLWTGIGGTTMLLYLAGLSNVPPDLLDAARVDGAGPWARFRHVTWPQLAPTTFFISVISIIGGLQGGFEQARVMTGGGPAGSTTTLSYYIYLRLFLDVELGYAAAISWVLFALIFVATAINWRFGRSLEVEQ